MNNIWDTLVNQIGPILIAAVVGIIGASIKVFGNNIANYIDKKATLLEQEAEQSKNKNEYESILRTAKEVWGIVDEKYRISNKVEDLMKSKADDFNKLLLKKIPYLTQDEVNYIRQAIAGEINQGKAKLLTDDTLKSQLVKEQQEKETIKIENEQLKAKLDQVKAVLPAQE